MKSKFNKIIIILIINLIYALHSNSEEINFEAGVIEFLDKDEKIIAKDNVKILTDKEIITSDEMIYYKDRGIAEVRGNLLLKKLDNSLNIFSDELIYKKKIEEITLKKNVLIELKNKFKFKTENAIYNKLENKIIIEKPLTIKDKLGNSISSKKSIFLINEELLNFTPFAVLSISSIIF